MRSVARSWLVLGARPQQIVVEGANGPTTPDGDAILEDRGVVVVPDILANSGGVAVSYFEWVQDLQAYFWSEDEVNDRLKVLMEAAYDDAAGVTAAFNKNVLAVLNRELDADFDPDAFEHVAAWDARNEWIEMRLRSLRDQTVRIAALDLEVSFAEGEEVRTEISAKFREDGVAAELPTLSK